MLKTRLALLLTLLLLPGCALNGTPREVPVAVSCPSPPPVPSVLLSGPATNDKPLALRFEDSLQRFEDSLTKAQR